MLMILQTHQAVGSAVEVPEKTSGKRFPSAQKILQAYMTFEALCDHSYTFACVSCGYHPVTVVMNLHKKGVFSMPGKCLCLFLKHIIFVLYRLIHDCTVLESERY